MSASDAPRALLPVVLGAGCSGLGAPAAPDGPATDTAPGTATPTAPAAAGTVTLTATPPRNPWRADPITVAVDRGDPEGYLSYYTAFALFADEPEDVPEPYRL